jgi:hypothetical protein
MDMMKIIGLAQQSGVAQPQANPAPNPTGFGGGMLAQAISGALLAQQQAQAQQAQASDSGISSLVPKTAPVDSNGRPMVFSEKYGWMPASGDGTVPGMMPQGGDFVPQTGTPGYTDGDRWNNQPPQQTVQPPSQSPLNRIYDERVQSPTDYPFMGGSPPISQPGNEVMDLNGRIAMASGPQSSTNYSQPQQMTPEQIFAILSESRNSNPFSRNRTSSSGMFDAMREALTSNVNPFRRG